MIIMYLSSSFTLNGLSNSEDLEASSMTVIDFPQTLIQAYLLTTYRVVESFASIDIRIGARHPTLDVLLNEMKQTKWAFITASNPASHRQSEPENQRRHHALVKHVQSMGFPVLDGVGLPDASSWPPEISLLVLGLDPKTAQVLGREWDQNAIVVGSLGTTAELIWCRRPADPLRKPSR